MSRRAFGGRTLMVWGAFVGNKLLDLVIVDQTMDSAKYTDMLNKSLEPFMKRGLTFMHVGASIHRTDETKKELKAEVLKQWSLIKPEQLTKLLKSMTERIVEVIAKQGGNTKY